MYMNSKEDIYAIEVKICLFFDTKVSTRMKQDG